MALDDAQQAQVDYLRGLSGEVDLDDDALYSYLVALGGSLNGAAAAVWGYKAAQAADYVDVQEGSSRRSLSGLRAAATAMADRYAAAAALEVPTLGGQTRMIPIARTTTLP